jgi:hypothetical protein
MNVLSGIVSYLQLSLEGTLKISLSPKFAWNQLLFENFGVKHINHGSIDFNK